MDRVAFLVESTGQRIRCLLNPETIVTRRRAGVRPRRSAGGLVTGTGLVDDPLLHVGGGSTEIDLDLLFDVTIDESTGGGSTTGPAVESGDQLPVDNSLADASTSDVRTLTRPLQQLTESSRDASTASPPGPPVVRLIWGKGWNVPGVIVAIAERFDFFAANGLPQRSWLRMRMRRVDNTAPAAETDASPVLPPPSEEDAPLPAFDQESLVSHELPGSGSPLDADPSDPPPAAERIDEIAFRHFGTSEAWRLIAAFNNLDNPAKLPAGATLQIPPRSALTQST